MATKPVRRLRVFFACCMVFVPLGHALWAPSRKYLPDVMPLALHLTRRLPIEVGDEQSDTLFKRPLRLWVRMGFRFVHRAH